MSPEQPHDSQPGIVGSMRQIVSAVLATIRTRMRILNVELQEEKLRLAELIVLGTVFILFLLMSFVLIIFLVIFIALEYGYAWEVTLALIIFFVVSATVLYKIIYNKIKHGPALFDTSISELKKDIEALTGKDDD